MKKFVIVMVFIFLIVILIAFNYVMLDNQNKNRTINTLDTAKSDTLNTLATIRRENEILTSEKDQLNKEIEGYKTELETYKSNLLTATENVANLEAKYKHKLSILDTIKSNIEPTLFENVAKEFIGNISKGEFLLANNLIYSVANVKSISLEKMKSYFNYENGIYIINSFNIVLTDAPENETGEIKFKTNVTISYSKRENNENKDVTKTITYFFTFEYDDYDSNWLIKAIDTTITE